MAADTSRFVLVKLKMEEILVISGAVSEIT